MLTAGDRIVWIGPDDEGQPHQERADRVIHAEGALVTPAFADAHVHLTMTGQGLDGIDLSGTRSVAEALRLIEAAARHTRGRPIYAHSWNETNWVERRPATATELDRAAYGGIVFMPRIDAHSACVSSAMAAVARVEGMDGWNGTGLASRQACAAVTNAFTAGITTADREHYLGLALRAAAEAGIGLIHETGGEHLTSFDDIAAVLEAGQRAGSPSTVAYWGALVESAAEATKLGRHLGILGLAGDLCADGSFGSRTAHLTQPYLDHDGQPGVDCGFGYLTADQIAAHVIACTSASLQSGVHVIGDAALHTVMQGFQAAADQLGVEAIRAARHRWEHVELPDAAVLKVMAELGIWASVQPGFDAEWGGPDGGYAAWLGPERALAANPLRSMLEAGVPLALGSDSPVTQLGPWATVRAACWHHNSSERLTPKEAFAAHLGGYPLAGRPGGRLMPGEPATYVMWDVDPEVPRTPEGLPDFAVEPDLTLPSARQTVVDGHLAFLRHDA